MPIFKTKTPNQFLAAKIVSQPSGNNPYYLLQALTIPDGEEANVVPDTATFFAQYDLSAGEEEESDFLNE